MEIARLVLDFLKVLVWPAVFLAVAYAFREEVRGLLKRVKALSAVGVDAEFSEAVEQVSAEAEEAVTQSEPQVAEVGPAPARVAERRERDSRLSSQFIDPSVAMLDAWDQVRRTLSRMVLEHSGYNRIGERVMTRLLWSERFFPHDIAQSLRELREIRNEVAHARRVPTVDAAEEYVASCERMVEWLTEYATSPAWATAVRRLESP
ncbi:MULTISPECIES: hypothetical protein [Streptomyces]|uniref:hypothetical protein n=1 Tax=Streptomyces TaxID=1883 RepID=UPI000BF0805B|nr:hypothetical protein [Streptomyces sp. b94]